MVLLGSLTACTAKTPAVDPPAARPSRYRILYRREEHAGAAVNRTWQRLTVVRPDASWDERFRDQPQPDSPPVSGTIATPDGLFSLGPQGPTPVTQRPPAPATGDQELGVVLPDLVARHLARSLTSSRVAGRPCRVFRFVEPPTGPLRPLSDPDAREHDDICIDQHGLVLGERWTHQGKVLLVREAVEVSEGLADEAVPKLPQPASWPPNGVRLDAVSGDVLQPPPAPAGYDRGRSASVAYPPLQGAPPVHSVEWSFVRGGGDLITVEAGQLSPDGPPWSSVDATRPVTIPGWRYAATLIRSDGAEVRGQLEGGPWVVIRGTTRPAELLRLAAQLRAA